MCLVDKPDDVSLSGLMSVIGANNVFIGWYSCFSLNMKRVFFKYAEIIAFCYNDVFLRIQF